LDASARWVLDKYISRPVFGVGAGYPLGSFFFLFLFSLFWGVVGSLFSYVVALLATLKTKRAKNYVLFWDFSKARTQEKF
jgi:hypothetical protein